MTTAKTPSNYYVDKAELCEELRIYRAKYLEAKAAGEPRPQASDFIGRAFMDIAEGIGSRPNWSGYTYIEEMKLDAVENCIKYAHLFDPERSSNPFGYFSLVIWRSFIKTMGKEKYQGKVVDESVRRMALSIDPSFTISEGFDPKDAKNSLIDWLMEEDDKEKLAYNAF
jgi:hypothetical protein